MENNFEELGIGESLIKGLAEQDIENPTEIQQHMIPLMLSGKDVIGRSETGSGKTLAYLLPIFQKLDMSIKGVQALILTPTHELAAQVHQQAELLESNSGIEVGCMMVIGSASMGRQLDKLKSKPRIIIGSTGRILDLIGRRKLPAHLIQTIILDEGDRLLEDGNFESIKNVVKTTLKQRQIVVLSASIGAETQGRAKEIMKEDVLVVESKTGALIPQGIEHSYILTTQRDKFVQLRKIVASDGANRIMVFLNNPENIEVTVDKLCYHGLKAVGIYGQVSKIDRKNAMDDFRQGRATVLVSSDIGARGLDIPGVTHIINMDVPEEPTQYLHRAGRCGRNGQEGTAITLVTPYERKWVHRYEKVWGLEFQQKEMAFGKLVESEKTKKDIEKPVTKKVIPETRAEKRKEEFKEEKKKIVKENKVIVEENKVFEEKEKLPEPKGFFAKKAKRLDVKEKNRQQNKKK